MEGIPLHCQPMYARPWETAPDSAWMLDIRIGVVEIAEPHHIEPEVAEPRYVEAVYELDDLMGCAQTCVDGWPLQVLN